MSSLSVREARAQLKFSRLAHFTPARNIWHIAEDGAIRSSKDLADNAPEYFDPTDRERFDRHPEMVCCSFEYPNGYYLAQARNKPEYANYRDWICLLLDPALVERPGALFCGWNAARGSGAYLLEGGAALLDCFANPSKPGGYSRGSRHHPGAASDLQAEVLVPGPIELPRIQAVVVPNTETALNLYGVLHRQNLGPHRFRWAVAPVFFTRDRLSQRIRFGGTIEETEWTPPADLEVPS